MSDPHNFNLQAAARECMLEHGFQPDFSKPVQDEIHALQTNPHKVNAVPDVRDLRESLWSSIDNDTSRDLDQIEVAKEVDNGTVRIQIAIADVDAYVPAGSAIDKHAAQQTATIYTGVHNFSMLPEELSTGLTSLLEEQERLSVVYEFSVDADGCVSAHDIYRATVVNRAQLAYPSVGAWLQTKKDAPSKVAASAELQKQLLLQNRVAQNLETIETHPLVVGNQLVNIETQQRSLATDSIEDFMIAANEVVAKSLEQAHYSSIRRVVKTPKRWDRIVELAAQFGTKLPGEPDSKALQDFLCERRTTDPEHFPDLSLAVIKLLGSGEYVLERDGESAQGHFGLAVQDYTHSTAPNRRYADLVTQRLVKAMLAGEAAPYTDAELAAGGTQCTLREKAGHKVERAMRKRVAAVAMANSIGRVFRGVITGVSDKGTYVRVFDPPVEGRVMRGEQGLDVGDVLNVKLLHTDPQHAFIDFARA